MNNQTKNILVSVIIPVFNEEKDIEDCINSLQKQNYKNIEIIIVDDGSTDKTLEVVAKFKKVKIIKGEHKGPGFSRNLGAKEAKGDILIFIDADMEFNKNYLRNLIKPIIKDKKVIGTTHELEIVKNINNMWSRCWGKIRVDYRNKKFCLNYGCFRAIRKDKFFELGCFDPKYGYADDQTFWFKYNLSPNVAKGTVCYHKNPETLKGVYEQSRWIGASMDNVFLRIKILKDIYPISLIFLTPISIPFLSIRKCFKNRDFKILFPWMLIFMTVRYFGNISGIFRNIYFKKNTR